MKAPQDSEDAFALALGKLILAHMPYGRPVPDPPLPQLPTAAAPIPPSATDAAQTKKIPDEYLTHNIVSVYGAYDDNNVERPFIPRPFVNNRDLWAVLAKFAPERAKRLMSWKIDGADHQVTKAIRIWYTYEREGAAGTPEDPKTVGAWLVIGYVGNGH
ncbi:MAG: hypothetical protein AB7P40_24275 [Chloroflexota bacterium]